jgi:hypothetical protein|uniref:Uncharacterized protein n=1 Tax=viral metagenome TaxID=1070528 RepID=A0A6C0LKY8_9ZZZZ
MKMKYIKLPIFLAAFVIGLLFVYLSAAPTETVLVYPTPENAGKIEYRDKAGNCFSYKANEVTCPKTGMKVIPIQE